MQTPSLSFLGVAGIALFLSAGVKPARAQSCQTASNAQPLAVVELFTSQGCSSCPPADRWLSTLKSQQDIVALSFHVNYWNYLGWKDPYATPETTERQRRIQRALGANGVYTPQVVLNGNDFRAWSRFDARTLPRLASTRAPSLSLRRDGQQVTAQVGASAGAAQWAGYWALLSDGLSQQVTRGENAGTRLVNDHVVTLYRPVPAWDAQQAHGEHLTLPAESRAEQRVVFVLTDASGVRPVQALALRCGADSSSPS